MESDINHPERAKLSTKLLQWLEKNKERLTEKLLKEVV